MSLYALEMDRYAKGVVGENRACEFLISNGHKILERNFRIKIGEIDIISLKDETLYFIEVKNWTDSAIHPLEIFNKRKVSIMKKVAEVFFYLFPFYRDRYYVSFGLIETGGTEVVFHFNLF